ncbi:hypothetical protein AKJ45_02395 [candidate division MSBL1 archaeon SCGC-AAA261F19]|uniref:site-specific DNA-methyltransferase (adenine-specific) n=1 Tax=candidate division MSBL1 archaeon SCGC-AAA261F19 TaxID=1698275 RepID=A0A133V9M1_9EURY|nr:hypothetical protein AKJ45_02395 [candidate division MSBL1 archaeon SCGC-AAA261F19]
MDQQIHPRKVKSVMLRTINRPPEISDEVWEVFTKKKVLVREVAKALTAAYDANGEYGHLTGMYQYYDFKNEFNHFVITAYLNSKLFDFFYKSVYGASHMAGGYLNFHSSYMNPLPIKKPTPNSNQKFKEKVSKVTKFSTLKYKIMDFFEKISTKLRNSERLLSEVLESDRRALQEGNRDKIWTKSVSFYPDQKNALLEKEFSEFIFTGDSEKPVISIYGINGQKEEEIYEMEFVDRNLMQIVYLSLKGLFDSRKKTETLEDVLSKTIVPVIRPNIWENTQNILKEVKEKIKEWEEDTTKGENFEPDIVKIDNRIQEIDNEIDAHVFDLYGLDREEIVTVLDSLETRESIKEDILEKFSDLQ